MNFVRVFFTDPENPAGINTIVGWLSKRETNLKRASASIWSEVKVQINWTGWTNNLGIDGVHIDLFVQDVDIKVALKWNKGKIQRSVVFQKKPREIESSKKIIVNLPYDVDKNARAESLDLGFE